MKIITKTNCALDQLIVRGPRSATKSVAVLLGLLILCSLPPACTRGSKPSPSPLDAEARQKGEEYWFNALTKCGDSYYGKLEPNDFTYQFNDVSVEMFRNPPTEASRLNGVEWSGSAKLRSKTSRMRVKKMEWDSWRNGSIFPLPVLSLKKVNGRWLFNDKEQPSPLVKGIDCADVN
jgi:hypothetical protein